MKYYLSCWACGLRYKSDFDMQICKSCGSVLEVVYSEKSSATYSGSFWDLEGILPKGKYRHYFLGATPLLKHKNNAWLKLEMNNPTRSFKDRGSVVEVAKALEYGYDQMVCASTGNMALSIAYYAKLSGIKVNVFISRDANRDKIEKIKKIGNTSIVRINGDFNYALRHAEAYSKKHGVFLSGDYCYRKEGQRTIAYEIMSSKPSTHAIFIPIGNATLFSGMYKALREMKDARKIKQIPKLIGVQAAGCMPIATAIQKNKNVEYTKPGTIADAIAVGYPTFGWQAVEAI